MSDSIIIGSIVWVDKPDNTGRGIVRHISAKRRNLWVEIGGRLDKEVPSETVRLWN